MDLLPVTQMEQSFPALMPPALHAAVWLSQVAIAQHISDTVAIKTSSGRTTPIADQVCSRIFTRGRREIGLRACPITKFGERQLDQYALSLTATFRETMICKNPSRIARL